MTTAEKYRQLEKSPVINIARFIFNDLKSKATNTTLEKVISDIKTGKTPSKQEKRFYQDDYFDWFKPDEIGSEKYLFNAKDKVSKYAYENKQATIYEPDTILINAIGDVGRISILKKQASSNQQITGIRLIEDVFVDYAYFYLLAHREYFYVDLFQTTLPIVNQKKINTIPFCYPIIEEQKRIVKGFEEIEKIKSIVDLHIIEDLNWKEEYKVICRNFFNLQFGTKEIVNELNHQLDLIKQLRQAFLREAMQGKLLKSTNTKETGLQLLAKIKAEKAKLIANKVLKKEKESQPMTEKEIPFEIPEHWAWCRLGEICTLITDGKHGDCNNQPNSGYYFLSAKDIQNGQFVYEGSRQITYNDFLETHRRTNLEPGDLCIVNTGATIGKSAFAPEDERTRNTTFQKSVAVIKVLKEYTNMRFVENFIINETPRLLKKSRGSAINNLLLGDMKNTLFPLPPLHEQEQIVAKLEELMTFCDGLEQSIKESQGYNKMLLQQVLREALQPKVETKVISIQSRKIEKPLKTIVAGHIINLNNTTDFGRVKFQKLLYLTEYICKIDFDSQYIQKVAGPYDDALIKTIEADFNRLRFFTVVQDNTENKRVRYNALPGAQELERLFLEYFPDESVKISNTLLKFRPLSWGECELVATLYAVWNNRIIKNEPITDDFLFNDFMAWDKQKIKYKDIFYKWLFWMKEERIIPDGWGKYIEKNIMS